MKFLIFSDSHGYTNGMDYAIEQHPDIRHVIHCGDVLADVEYLRDCYGDTHAICAVCGNNDFRHPDPDKRVIPVEGHRIYVTHGHKEHVKQTLHTVSQAAKQENCDICIFGHTHVQHREESEGFLLLNPGSIGYYRTEYAILRVEKDTVEITLCKI